ncbi:hypothetical protein OSTOST_06103 [Ostertagia ostertagi]
MTFLGAVKVEVELEGGGKAEVAFHISDVKEEEILLGTNALKDVGVQVVLAPREAKTHSLVCERELTGTDRVKMDIDTGEHKPVKMKARPVPLGNMEKNGRNVDNA